MKLIVKKENDEIITKIKYKNEEKEEEFSNLKLIDYLYKNNEPQIQFEFDNISSEEQAKIKLLYEEIKRSVNEYKS